MTISTDKPKFRRAYPPASALAKSVTFDADFIHVTLTDGRIISAPIRWFPILSEATIQQRSHYEIGRGVISIYWPDIDEGLSVAGIIAGGDLRSL